MMGLHLPGSSFINPGTPLRKALTEAAARQVTRMTKVSGNYQPVGRMIDEKSFVNGMVGWLATGGSTNHTMHLLAMAKAAGIILTWQDLADLSDCVPLLTRIYPNGQADINHFQEAGGMATLIHELLSQGLVHEDVDTICGKGLTRYTQAPELDDDTLTWADGPRVSLNPAVLTSVAQPFNSDGGL
jgi:phosphogluconate dehydratase